MNDVEQLARELLEQFPLPVKVSSANGYDAAWAAGFNDAIDLCEKDALRTIIAALSAPKQVEDDADRIDWLESMANKPGGLLLHDGTETGRTGLALRPGFVRRTLRQAIDTASSPQPAPQPVEGNEWEVPPPGSYEAAMVVIERDNNGTPTIWCDPEVVDLVTALNTNRLRTVASCSGHGHRPGFIALKDGRMLLVCASLDEAQKADHVWPDINGNTRQPEQPAIDLQIIIGDGIGGIRAEALAIASRSGGMEHLAANRIINRCDAIKTKLLAIIDGAKAGRPVLPASALRPRTWTVAMSEAWHRAIPDTVKAFDDLIAAAEAGRAEGEES